MKLLIFTRAIERTNGLHGYEAKARGKRTVSHTEEVAVKKTAMKVLTSSRCPHENHFELEGIALARVKPIEPNSRGSWLAEKGGAK